MKSKVLLIFILLIFLFSIFNTVKATEYQYSNSIEVVEVIKIAKDKISAGEMMNDADAFLDKANEQYIKESELKNFSNTIYNVLLVVAIILSVIVGIVLGIKLVSSGAIGKAEVQKSLVPYIVGVVVVFGAFGIWKLVVTILNTVQ